MALQMAKLKSCLCSLRRKFLYFSKASFFLSGLVFGNALAEYSFLGFLIVCIKKNLKWDNLWYEAVICTAQGCFSAFLASFLAYTTHQRIRPLIMILVTHAIFIAGMVILLFHQKSPIDGMFYLALALLSVHISAEEYMKEFLTDQLVVNQSEQVIDDAERTNNRIDAWRFIARFAGAVIGGVLIPRLPTSKQLYIPAIFVGIGFIFFYSYCKCYEVSSGDHGTEKHELRPLLKLLPLWAPFLIYYVVDAAGSALFGYEAYLYIIQKFSGIIVSRLIGYVLTKFCGEDQHVQQRIRLAKIIFGMLICFLLCIDTWYVQAKRKSKGSLMFYLEFILLGIMKEMVEEMMGKYFCDQVPDQSMHHLEFTFNRFVEGMGRLLAAIIILVSRNWIGDKIEKNGEVVKDSQLDEFFRTLAFMSLWALFMFVYLSNTCYLKKETEDINDHLVELEESSLSRSSRRPSEPQSSSLHSSSISQSTASFPGEKSISASSEAAALPNLESAGSSVNRDYWSIVKRYIKERSGAKDKSS